MFTEIKIIAVSPNDTKPYKGLDHNGRAAFVLDVTYTLADGRTIKSDVTSSRKKDVPGALARAQQAAAAGSFLASFDDQGRFFGTVSKWQIGLGPGPAGLIPDPDPEPVPVQVAA